VEVVVLKPKTENQVDAKATEDVVLADAIE
jgi:hypothetical protein